MDEDVRNSELLIRFNSLEEIDKDIVINISESLIEKWEKNMANTCKKKNIQKKNL